ncbi:MAG TPA: hypothetical protein VI391_10145 [Thermoanaerobaculia bacterium]
MPVWGVLAFFAVFIGAGALIFIASARQQKRWRARPAILRALAQRRGYSVVEQPGKPSELVPIRPLDHGADLKKMELPIALRGRTVDANLTLFDVFTRSDHHGSRGGYTERFQTFITIKSGQQWPHFEFSAVAQPRDGSFAAALVTMTGALAEAAMSSRGLVHVPIPDHPGYQLFAEPAVNGAQLRDALVPLFASRGPWWVGALDNALTMQRCDSKSIAQGQLVDENGLDRFIDEAIDIERTLRAAIRP